MPSPGISSATSPDSSIRALRIRPWGEMPSAAVRPAIQAECLCWLVDLGWDLARDWAAVEPARRNGLLPGWVAIDEHDDIVGWAFAADAPDVRQLGALVAEDPIVARALAQEVVDSTPGATGGFVRASGAIDRALFEARGFQVQPYEYLVASLLPRHVTDHVDDADVDRWRDADADDVAELFEHAYAADRSVRPFARSGSRADWCDYVDALTRRPGCGVFSPESSVVMRDRGRIIAVALVTSVGPTTAHLAQIAVTPAARARGLGSTLLAAACQRAATHLRASRLSLLVSGANQTASRLYARAGFRKEGEFLALSRT